jgi:hypothetical protein
LTVAPVSAGVAGLRLSARLAAAAMGKRLDEPSYVSLYLP